MYHTLKKPRQSARLPARQTSFSEDRHQYAWTSIRHSLLRQQINLFDQTRKFQNSLRFFFKLVDLTELSLFNIVFGPVELLNPVSAVAGVKLTRANHSVDLEKLKNI